MVERKLGEEPNVYNLGPLVPLTISSFYYYNIMCILLSC